MIFPRGEFSGSAMQALRESTLVAAVNTELIDTQTGRGVKVEELLQPAITAYSGFPLFLRRPASEPIANFALDLLLGKPCLVGMHHDYFRGGDDKFIALVKSLNALDPTLDANLPPERLPVEEERRVRIRGQLPSLPALVVRVEAEAAHVGVLQQHHSRRGSSVRCRGRERRG